MPTRTALSVLLVATALLIVAAVPPNAPIFSSELQVSPDNPTGANRYVPAIAYNSVHHEFLVVWHNTQSSGHRDVYARRVTTSGEIKTWFSVSAGTDSRFQPAVAYNPVNDNYLVVWVQDPGDGVHYEIWGRIVAWNGASMGTEFQILQWSNRAFWYPRVVWNGYRNEYLMVANGWDTVSGAQNDITARRVSAAGSVPGGVLVYQDPKYHPNMPSLAYNIAADNYLVAWRHSNTSSNWDIHGALVAGDGSSVTRSDLTLDNMSNDQDWPVVATNSQGRYLVIWKEYVGSDWDIYGKEFNVNGDAVTASYGIAYSTDNEQEPAVVGQFGLADTTDFLAVWQRTTASGKEIWARRWGTAVAGYMPPAFQVAGATFWENAAPAVAGGPTYLMAYEGDSTSDPTVYRHIYARVWSPNGVFLPLLNR